MGALFGAPPTVERVRISPESPHVDDTVTCTASVSGLGDGETVMSWRNATRKRDLGEGESLKLRPDSIRPGESLVCTVTATNSAGAAEGSAQTSPACGVSKRASLTDTTVSLHILFRPWITEDVIPGYGGAPWDWDGNIPDWLLDVADALEELLDVVTDLYPDPDLVAADEAVTTVNDILEAVDEYGPELLKGDVPPDPDLFPYQMTSGGEPVSIRGFDASAQWDNTYEVTLDVPHVDLVNLDGFVLDMEDLDLAFDDNMGDYLTQGASPLVFLSEALADSAYCPIRYANPKDRELATETAYIPGSILWMEIEVH